MREAVSFIATRAREFLISLWHGRVCQLTKGKKTKRRERGENELERERGREEGVNGERFRSNDRGEKEGGGTDQDYGRTHQPGLRKRVDAGACPLPTRHARQTVWFLCQEEEWKRTERERERGTEIGGGYG